MTYLQALAVTLLFLWGRAALGITRANQAEQIIVRYIGAAIVALALWLAVGWVR